MLGVKDTEHTNTIYIKKDQNLCARYSQVLVAARLLRS